MPAKIETGGGPWARAILHLDMDAFYVNVHIQDHPEDAGIPLVVGGRPDQRGVVSSASYEARQMGIHSAMPTSRARRIYRQLKIVPADWTRIRERSRQVMAVLERYGPLEQVSVDEAYLDLREHNNPVSTAAAIKRDVKETTSLPCSVGLASSKLVAKVASDHDKPDGFTVVQPGKEAAFLAPKPTRALWGIGPRSAERLAAIQIHTCGQLAEAEVDKVRRVLGRYGIEFIQRAQGIDAREVHIERRQAKSISQEWTFNNDVNDPAQLEARLSEMCKTVAGSLRKKGLVAHTVTVKIRWADFTTFTRQKSYEVGFDGEKELLHRATAIWRENWEQGQFIRLLGVGVSNLEVPEVRQLQLPLLKET
ncbi:MAG: DNA polymerase IV [Candidatus Promineifilaceae bacterium]